MIYTDFELTDGLYNVKNGELFKYKKEGGSVRVHEVKRLVRCKDCKHYKPFDKSKKFDCPQGLYAVFESDYCSHGERSEE